MRIQGAGVRTVKGIFIDARNQEVRAVKQRPDTLAHRLGCSRVMIAPLLVDLARPMALYASGDKGRRTYGFTLTDSPFPVNGYGILLGIDLFTKEDRDIPVTVEAVRKSVTFF